MEASVATRFSDLREVHATAMQHRDAEGGTSPHALLLTAPAAPASGYKRSRGASGASSFGAATAAPVVPGLGPVGSGAALHLQSLASPTGPKRARRAGDGGSTIGGDAGSDDGGGDAVRLPRTASISSRPAGSSAGGGSGMPHAPRHTSDELELATMLANAAAGNL